MSNLNPYGNPPDLKNVYRDTHGLVQHCRAMLYIHGFITDAEDTAVRKRIVKWLEMHAATPEPRDE